MVASCCCSPRWPCSSTRAMATRPPRLAGSAPSAELGAESPAVASLLTNGFVVTPRGRRRHPARPRRPAAGCASSTPSTRSSCSPIAAAGRVTHLTGYEQQVLNHVHKLTAGTLTGVSRRGCRDRRPAPAAAVVATVHARRSCATPGGSASSSAAGVCSPSRRRSSRWCCRVCCGGARCAAANAPRSPTPCRPGRSPSLSPSPSFSSPDGSSSACARGPSARRSTGWCVPSTGCACGRGWSRGGSKAPRPARRTARAGPSPTPPPSVSPSGPPTSCRSCPRMTAWPGATPPASGTSCASGTRSVRATGAIRPSCWPSAWRSAPGSSLLQQFLLRVARGDALQGIVEDFPDQADLIQDAALVLAAAVIVPLVWMAWLVIAGSFDLFSTVERQGVVVRARRPAARRAVPAPPATVRPARPLRPVHRRRRWPFRPGQRLALQRADRRAPGRPGPGQGHAGARLRPPVGAHRHDTDVVAPL